VSFEWPDEARAEAKGMANHTKALSARAYRAAKPAAGVLAGQKSFATRPAAEKLRFYALLHSGGRTRAGKNAARWAARSASKSPIPGRTRGTVLEKLAAGGHIAAQHRWGQANIVAGRRPQFWPGLRQTGRRLWHDSGSPGTIDHVPPAPWRWSGVVHAKHTPVAVRPPAGRVLGWRCTLQGAWALRTMQGSGHLMPSKRKGAVPCPG